MRVCRAGMCERRLAGGRGMVLDTGGHGFHAAADWLVARSYVVDSAQNSFSHGRDPRGIERAIEVSESVHDYGELPEQLSPEIQRTVGISAGPNVKRFRALLPTAPPPRPNREAGHLRAQHSLLVFQQRQDCPCFDPDYSGFCSFRGYCT